MSRIATLPPPRITPLPPAPAAAALRTVLVADGNTTTASLTRTLSRVTFGRDASYVSVASGPEAVEAVGARRPDLVISEFRLSGSDGVETLRRIRERLGTKVPAVFTVAKIEQDYVRRRLPERATLLVRPFDRSSLEAAIRTLFAAT